MEGERLNGERQLNRILGLAPMDQPERPAIFTRLRCTGMVSY